MCVSATLLRRVIFIPNSLRTTHYALWMKTRTSDSTTAFWNFVPIERWRVCKRTNKKRARKISHSPTFCAPVAIFSQVKNQPLLSSLSMPFFIRRSRKKPLISISKCKRKKGRCALELMGCSLKTPTLIKKWSPL